MTPATTWTVEQCAAHWEVSPSRWRALVAGGHAPAPLPGYDPDTGRRRWDPDTVREAKLLRKGQGFRTDLHPGGRHRP